MTSINHTVLHSFNGFELVKERPRSGFQRNSRPRYTIRLTGSIWYNSEIVSNVRQMIDPHHSISGKKGKRWSFRDKATADMFWTALVLQYG